MARRIEVVPYNPAWSTMFSAEAAKIAAVLGDQVVATLHIGSTAIPGIKAKPIIDLLVVVQDIERIDDYHEAMEGLGYEPMGEHGIPGRRFYRKPGKDTRTHHVHVYAQGHSEVQRHLDFRDYLRAHPLDAQAYSRLKERLAVKFPDDADRYVQGKSALIEEIDAKAKAWRKASRPNQ